MAHYYDAFGRRRGLQPDRRPVSDAGSQGLPTLDDYRALAQAYQELQDRYVQQTKDLASKTRELEIKNEALQRQGNDMKQTEAELVWTRAALQQQPGAASPGNAADDLTWQERFLRLQAEIDGLRNRWEQRYTTETTEARHRILRDMLPLADHLELALNHTDALASEHAREFVHNIEATLQAFRDTLKRYGVEAMEALKQPFDPNLHEAVGQIDDASLPPGTVAQVVQTGYMEGDKLLRPARVMVSRGEVE